MTATVAASADVEALARSLIGAGHLLLADRTGTPPTPGAVRAVVAGVLGTVTAS